MTFNKLLDRNLDEFDKSILRNNATDTSTSTTLHHAIVANQGEIFKILLDYGADIIMNLCDERGNSPLAVHAGNIQFVKFLWNK